MTPYFPNLFHFPVYSHISLFTVHLLGVPQLWFLVGSVGGFYQTSLNT